MAHTRHNRLIIHHQHYTERMQNASLGDISIIHNSPLALSPAGSKWKQTKAQMKFELSSCVRVVCDRLQFQSKAKLYEGKIERLCPQHQFLLRLYLFRWTFFWVKKNKFYIVARWIVLFCVLKITLDFISRSFKIPFINLLL